MNKATDLIDALFARALVNKCEAYDVLHEIGAFTERCEEADFQDCPNCMQECKDAAAGFLDSFTLPRPVFEDGAPIKQGDQMAKMGPTERVVGYRVNENGRCTVESEFGQYSFAVRVPQKRGSLFDADGAVINQGDEVFVKGREHLSGKAELRGGTVRVVRGTDYWDCDPLMLAHRKADTQEYIDRDVSKEVFDYWGCGSVDCDECPVKEDGKRPHERFRSGSCETAKTLDLLRRQRELDARTMGGDRS